MIYNPSMYTVHRLPIGYPAFTDIYSLTSRSDRWLTHSFLFVRKDRHNNLHHTLRFVYFSIRWSKCGGESG